MDVKSLINKIKPDKEKAVEEEIKNVTNKMLEEEMENVINMMKKDSKRFNDEFLLKYAELIEEITELQSKKIEVYELINLTSHNINILDENNETLLEIEPSGNLARVKKDSEFFKTIVVEDKTIDVVKNTFGEVENLPVPKEGVGYIVSRMVANERPGRKDLFYPEELVYDQDGKVIGCRKLGQK